MTNLIENGIKAFLLVFIIVACLAIATLMNDVHRGMEDQHAQQVETLKQMQIETQRRSVQDLCRTLEK